MQKAKVNGYILLLIAFEEASNYLCLLDFRS